MDKVRIVEDLNKEVEDKISELLAIGEQIGVVGVTINGFAVVINIINMSSLENVRPKRKFAKVSKGKLASKRKKK